MSQVSFRSPLVGSSATAHVERIGKFQYLAVVSCVQNSRRHSFEFDTRDPFEAQALAIEFCQSNFITLTPFSIPSDIRFLHEKDSGIDRVPARRVVSQPFYKKGIAV